MINMINWYKYSRDMTYDDSLQKIKQEKLQEEKAIRDYDIEKTEMEYERSLINNEAHNSENPDRLSSLLKGLSGIDPSQLTKRIVNQSVHWKNAIIGGILQNPSTPQEALSIFWKYKIKPILEQNIEKLSGTGLFFDVSTVKILQHRNSPSQIFEEFSEIILKYSLNINFRSFSLDLTEIIKHPNFSQKAFETLYKIKKISERPSIHQAMAYHPNAPTDLAVNYILTSQDYGKIKGIKNLKAIEQLLKLTGDLIGFPPVKIEELVSDSSTSTLALAILANLDKELERKIPNYKTNSMAIVDLDSDYGNLGEGTETLRHFVERIEKSIAIHPNAPVYWSIAYIKKNPVNFDEIKNPEVLKEAKTLWHKEMIEQTLEKMKIK